MCFRLVFVLYALCLSLLPFTAGYVSFGLTESAESFVTGDCERQGVALIDKVRNKRGDSTGETIAAAHQQYKELIRGTLLFVLYVGLKIYLRVGEIEDNKFRLYYGRPRDIVLFSLTESGEILYTGVYQKKGVASIYEVTDKYGNPNGLSILDAHRQFKEFTNATILIAVLNGNRKSFVGVDEIINNEFLFRYEDPKILPTSPVNEVQDAVPSKQDEVSRVSYSLTEDGEIFYTGVRLESGIALIDEITDSQLRPTRQSMMEANRIFKDSIGGNLFAYKGGRKIIVAVGDVEDNKFLVTYRDPDVLPESSVKETHDYVNLKQHGMVALSFSDGKIFYSGLRKKEGVVLITNVTDREGNRTGQSLASVHKLFLTSIFRDLFALNGDRNILSKVDAMNLEDNGFLISYFSLEDGGVAFTFTNPEMRPIQILYSGKRFKQGGGALIDTVWDHSGARRPQTMAEAYQIFKASSRSQLFPPRGDCKTLWDVGEFKHNTFPIVYNNPKKISSRLFSGFSIKGK